MVDLIREFYAVERGNGHACYISTMVHSVLLCVATLQTVWHPKGWLTDAGVNEGKGVAARLRQPREMLGWKPTVWVHWTLSHSGFHMERYRSIFVIAFPRNTGFLGLSWNDAVASKGGPYHAHCRIDMS